MKPNKPLSEDMVANVSVGLPAYETRAKLASPKYKPTDRDKKESPFSNYANEKINKLKEDCSGTDLIIDKKHNKIKGKPDIGPEELKQTIVNSDQ